MPSEDLKAKIKGLSHVAHRTLWHIYSAKKTVVVGPNPYGWPAAKTAAALNTSTLMMSYLERLGFVTKDRELQAEPWRNRHEVLWEITPEGYEAFKAYWEEKYPDRES